MRESSKIEDFGGNLSEVCKAYIAEKRALGYDGTGTACKLNAFIRFAQLFEFPPNTLPKEVVRAWLVKNPNENERNLYERFVTVRGLAEYMARMVYDAYVPLSGEVGKLHKKFVPYIFTHDEIQAFFKAADALTYKLRSASPRRHLVMPVLFRMLYCCGLRVSEACNLLGSDVDMENNVLVIRDSKFGKSRYVPISDELCSVCRKYNETRLVIEDEDWFFAAPGGGRYAERSVYHVFRCLLFDAGISHGGKGKGPRMHDLRHTFAVHCLQKWVANGTELTNAIPRLSVYLGHEGFESTEQYLRMTAEVYPEISDLLQKEYGYIIPQLEVCE